MMNKSFKQFISLKESSDNDWKKDSLGPPLVKGFIPPPKLRPVIKAFLNSGSIVLHKDMNKPLTMPQKTLYLVGGPVRDFIMGKSIKDLDLATNATPEQIAIILSSAGFKKVEDRSGKSGAELKLPSQFWNADEEEKKIEDAKEGDKLLWFIKGRDNSEERKPFVISAVVDGEEFEIATFRKDAKVTDGQAAVDFVDNPAEDAARRDLTINSLYIELNSPDSENKKLYDPTGHGLHDLKQGVVKTVGKPEDRFEEDPLRVMRAIRFWARFGKTEKMDPEMLKAMRKFTNLRERVALERIRDEFLKGLLHSDVDTAKYITAYRDTGLLKTVFPGLNFDPPNGMPVQFSEKKEKPLALAWLLQHNPTEKVAEVLSPKHNVGGEEKPTGWQTDERKAVLFLLKLKEFSPEQVSQYMKMREGTGLSNQQIRDWVDMFKHKDTNRHVGPMTFRAKHVKAFAGYNKGVTWDHAVQGGHDVCPTCKGSYAANCSTCRGSGKAPENTRSDILNKLEAERFKDTVRTAT